MKETDYIKVQNLALLRGVMGLLRNILGGDEYGVTSAEIAEIYEKTSLLSIKCSNGIAIDKTEEQDEKRNIKS